MRLKSIGIALAMICSLLFVSVVNAHITSFSVYAGTDYGGGGTITADVSADEGIEKIHWYVGNSDVTTTTHDGATSVYENLGAFEGHVKSRKYTVDAIVHFADGTIETAIDTVTVDKPIIRDGFGEDTGVWGSSTIYSQYFTGSAFGFSASAYAYNGTNHTLSVHGWFRQQEWTSEDGDFVDVKRDDDQPADREFKPGETYCVYPDSMKIEFPQNGPLGEDEARYFNAHTHLQVSGRIDGLFRSDDWEADTEQQTGTTAVKFTHED